MFGVTSVRSFRWVVDLQPVGRGEKALTYLARYVQKTALDAARLVRFDAESVTIAWRERPKHPGDRRGLARQTRLSSPEFLRRFLQHVLPPGFQRVRHGGFYSAAAREKYSRLAALLGHRAPPPAEPWQMQCEQCGGAMPVASICQHFQCCPSGNAARWRSHSVRLRRLHRDHPAPGEARASDFDHARRRHHTRTRPLVS